MLRKQGATPVVAPDADFVEYRSPGLQLVFERIRALGKPSMLDLGPPLAANVDFLSRYPCRIYIGDWLESLPRQDEPGSEPAPPYCPVFGQMLPFSAKERFDIIFCWDLLNYMNADSIRGLSRFLAGHCNAGALCFFSIMTQKSMPLRPCRYRIKAEDTLQYQLLTSQQTASPRFTQSRILELMPEFQIQRSFLLKTGSQEQVFRIR